MRTRSGCNDTLDAAAAVLLTATFLWLHSWSMLTRSWSSSRTLNPLVRAGNWLLPSDAAKASEYAMLFRMQSSCTACFVTGYFLCVFRVVVSIRRRTESQGKETEQGGTPGEGNGRDKEKGRRRPSKSLTKGVRKEKEKNKRTACVAMMDEREWPIGHPRPSSSAYAASSSTPASTQRREPSYLSDGH